MGTENHILPLSTPTVHRISLPQNGFFGYTREPGQDSKQGIAGLPKQRRWLVWMTLKQISYGFYATGYAMNQTENGQ